MQIDFEWHTTKLDNAEKGDFWKADKNENLQRSKELLWQGSHP